jgi:hypothetical protein
VGQHRRHDAARHRRDVDDLPCPARPHRREHRLDPPPRPERVGLELPPQLVLSTELGRSVQAEAGVVDQHVDPLVLGEDGRHDGIDLGGDRDVEPNRLDAVLMTVRNGGTVATGLAHRRHDGVATRRDQPRRCGTEPPRCAGDQHDLSCHAGTDRDTVPAMPTMRGHRPISTPRRGPP